jgi:tetratricopeptide (TPR) repeat protein
MVGNHEDVRRFFNDGIAWIHVGQTELNYTRYVQCLQDLVSQLDVDEQEEPHFPELLHIPGESPGKRRRREEGFMIYLRETMVEFLRFRNVLVILDDVCFEPDLDWFDFAPGPMPDGQDEDEGSCAILVTSRRRDILPPADTVEVEMLEQTEGLELLIQESGELSESISVDSSVIKSVIVQCASHPLTVKSVARWLNLKLATTGDITNTEKMRDEVESSMTRILSTELEQDADMMYEVLNLSLSPAINGEPTSIIKFCFAAFVRVFCERKYISDFALADFSTIVPMSTTQLLFESILDLEEEVLVREGSLFYAQKGEAATIIPEALSALGVFKVIITYAEASDENDEQEVEDEKYLQIMHRIQQEYGEYLYEEDTSLTELMKDGEKRWNKSFAKAFLAKSMEWDTESPDAGLDYALEMMPTHLIRGGMLTEAANLLCNASFVRGRVFALGRESGTQRHIKDCEILYDIFVLERNAGCKKYDAKGSLKQAYNTLGSFLSMEEDELIKEEGSLAAIEMGRSYFWIGFSLAEKRCWEAAITHWETAQEYLVSALGMVELVAGILFNVGVLYAEMNEYEKSLGALKQCLRIRGAIHGEEHILYAQTIQRIGDVFLAMSDYHEAMESYNWALDVMHIEPSHHRIDIGDILENMGNVHYSKGAIEESLLCYQDALRSKQVDLGEDHPELASSFHKIGNCLSSQGKTNEAIAHLEEAIRLKKLDPDGGFERDSDVLTIEGVLHNLNTMQQEGLQCYEKSLQILVTKVPHKKEKVASLLHLIGCVYLMSGEHKKAMKLFEESLQARRKVLGFVHLDVASTLFNMAFLHQTRHKLDKALKCLEEALKIRQLRLPDSEKVAVTHEKIGSLAKAIGKTKKAEIAFNEALRIRKLIHGDNHEAVATVLQELGDLMDDLGMYDAAMKHYVEALEIRENRLGPDDLAVAETYYSMGFTLQNNGGEDRAVQCLEESLSIRKFNLGDDAKEVGDTLNMLGFLQAQRGELNDALSLLWESLRIRKIQQDNVKVSETLNNIGNVHREKGEFEFAVECYEECLRIRRAELGDDNEKVADALVALGNVYSDMDKKDESMDYYKEGK